MEVLWSKTLFKHKTTGKWQWGDSKGSSLAMSLLDDITNNIGLLASIIVVDLLTNLGIGVGEEKPKESKTHLKAAIPEVRHARHRGHLVSCPTR